MARPACIVLIGFMGSGKSTVGRLLARRLGFAFVDADALVAAREGASIARIFAERGEPGFRAAEAAALRELEHREKIVVACGGDAPLQAGNAWFFAPGEGGTAVFFLHVSLAVARERTGSDRGRPLLGRGDAEVARLFEERAPSYERLGTRIETDGRTPAAIVDAIIELLGSPTRRTHSEEGA